MKIDQLFKKEIGGINQWIRIFTEDNTKPVLLMLHGGPGTPCMSLFRKNNGTLAKHFILVTWDQRGTGRSYNRNIPPLSMNVEQLIEDTHEITAYVKERFTQEKIFILGHSFGATLALQVIDRYPEDYLVYFAVSQFVNATRNEAESYAFARQKAMENNDRKSLKILDKIGRPVDGFYESGLKGTVTVKRIVSKYKGDMYRSGSTMGLVLGLMISKEYGFFRFPSSLMGISFSLEHLGRCLKGIDYFTQIPEVNVPVYFFSGAHDYLTPQNILKEYYEILSAPCKKLIVFENSAHSPLWEEADLFHQKMIEIVTQYGS
jgi:pimeloyl-ACP methyl ester carboxylesterase